MDDSSLADVYFNPMILAKTVLHDIGQTPQGKFCGIGIGENRKIIRKDENMNTTSPEYITLMDSNHL